VLSSLAVLLILQVVSLSHYLGPRPPMRPDSVPDLGAIQIIYLLTYLLSFF